MPDHSERATSSSAADPLALYGRTPEEGTNADAHPMFTGPTRSAVGALSDHEVNRLATYNAEVTRGLLHTPEWADEMVALQRRFDKHGYVSAERDRLLDKFLGGSSPSRGSVARGRHG